MRPAFHHPNLNCHTIPLSEKIHLKFSEKKRHNVGIEFNQKKTIATLNTPIQSLSTILKKAPGT